MPNHKNQTATKSTTKKPLKKPWNKKRIIRLSWTIVCVIMLLSMVAFTVLPGLKSFGN